MYREDFLGQVIGLLRLNDIRKNVSVPKQVFHISDDNGNSKTFSIKGIDKTVIYTKKDVDNILEACLFVIKEALRRGDSVNLKGFGKFSTKYRKSKKIHTYDGRIVDSTPRYYIHFLPAPDLKEAAESYGAIALDKIRDVEEFFPSEESEAEE